MGAPEMAARGRHLVALSHLVSEYSADVATFEHVRRLWDFGSLKCQ